MLGLKINWQNLKNFKTNIFDHIIIFTVISLSLGLNPKFGK